MKRVRLTKRLASTSRKADSATPETAIDLGKNRTYHKIDEYHTFEQTVNHELPDMRHEWKDNPRTETGHGIPKMAKVYLAAKKATKLAMLLLGEKAQEAAIEGQARAFMRMGDAALTASLSRYAETKGEGDTVCNNCASDEEKATTCNASDEEKATTCNASDEEKATTCNASDEEAQAEAPAVEEAPADAQAEAPAAEEAPVAEGDIEIDEAGDDTEVSFDDDEVAEEGADADADAAELRACFAADAEDGEEISAPAQESGNRKAGLKKLAGQPTLVRVASKSDDLTSLWDKWENPSIR